MALNILLEKAAVTPAAMLAQNRSRYDRAHRGWSVTKGGKLPDFDALVWTRTIGDVHLDATETYCSDVKLWANSVLNDTGHLVQALDV